MQLRKLPLRRDVDGGGRRLHERITREITAVIHQEMNRIAVVADESTAPVVEAHAVLSAAAGQLEIAGARIEKEALAAHRHGPRVRLVGAADVAAGMARRDVEAVVEAPLEGVEHCLAALVAVEAGEDRLAPAGLAVENVRHDADEDPAIPASDGDRRVEIVDVDGTLAITAVGVHVLEQT